VALSLGVPAGTALATVIGWRACFAALAGLATAAAAWVRWKVPALAVQDKTVAPRTVRAALSTPGVTRTLLVTLLVLTGHQVMYTYAAPFLAWARFGKVSFVLMVFGVATIGGVWVAGARADRHLRSTLMLTLTTIIVAMGALELRTTLIAGVTAWGLAYGAAPTLLQTALIKSSGSDNADVATALQTTVYNVGIAAGSLLGGILLQGPGAGFLPPGTALLTAGALAIAARTTRRAPEAARNTPARCCP
jgi:predicted MFS family arabinose efflux permease